MTKESAKRASRIMDEIDKLSEYKKLLGNRSHGQVAHFELVQHYGDEPESVVFDPKYNPRFEAVVKEIIEELEVQLKELV